ncbi:hypothetical protein OESDEN_00848 [Oesophagostomum dentatum]|uniref:Uncharacterized protein n=1 Tax=Oesophagostomum dentatum TaxID=61180 RepID=A0A0B1TTN1_OESDE|nr:hypothetical protein OESDEN_00848 [Oesophagostomum dentatum]
MFYDGLVALMKRLGTKPSDPYDWETKDQVEKVLKHNSKRAAWEDADEFFKSDPTNIHAPPMTIPTPAIIFKGDRFEDLSVHGYLDCVLAQYIHNVDGGPALAAAPTMLIVFRR